MSEKAKPLMFADLAEALKNFPKFADVIKEESDDWSSAMKIWKDRVYAWKEDFEGLVLELQKQLQEKLRENKRAYKSATRFEKEFLNGANCVIEELLGETKR